MDLTTMLDQMCLDELSDADIKAIGKARGFNATETASRSQLAAVLLSNIGVKSAMQKLSTREAACLHLLHQINEPVRVDFFERVYGSAHTENYSYRSTRTFTQAYQSTFKSIRKQLIRKGLLLAAEDRGSKESTILERIKCSFPEIFAPYLPPLVPETLTSEGTKGENRSEWVWRNLVKQVFSQTTHEGEVRAQIIDGQIRIGDHPLCEKVLIWWSKRTWAQNLDIHRSFEEPYSVNPVDAIPFMLSSLPPNAWASTLQLLKIYEVFCHQIKAPDLPIILKQGWKWGLLDRLKVDDRVYYRLSDRQTYHVGQETDPATFLKVTPEADSMMVDLNTIPFSILNILNRIAVFSLAGHQLKAAPSFYDLGMIFPNIRHHPLISWLSQNIDDFKKMFEAAEQNWGKTLLHDHLLVAEVRDLNLRVQIEKALGEKALRLSESFIAFPQDSLGKIENIVSKTGFVIKTRTATSEK